MTKQAVQAVQDRAKGRGGEQPQGAATLSSRAQRPMHLIRTNELYHLYVTLSTAWAPDEWPTGRAALLQEMKKRLSNAGIYGLVDVKLHPGGHTGHLMFGTEAPALAALVLSDKERDDYSAGPWHLGGVVLDVPKEKNQPHLAPPTPRGGGGGIGKVTTTATIALARAQSKLAAAAANSIPPVRPIPTVPVAAPVTGNTGPSQQPPKVHPVNWVAAVKQPGQQDGQQSPDGVTDPFTASLAATEALAGSSAEDFDGAGKGDHSSSKDGSPGNHSGGHDAGQQGSEPVEGEVSTEFHLDGAVGGGRQRGSSSASNSHTPAAGSDSSCALESETGGGPPLSAAHSYSSDDGTATQHAYMHTHGPTNGELHPQRQAQHQNGVEGMAPPDYGGMYVAGSIAFGGGPARPHTAFKDAAQRLQAAGSEPAGMVTNGGMSGAMNMPPSAGFGGGILGTSPSYGVQFGSLMGSAPSAGLHGNTGMSPSGSGLLGSTLGSMPILGHGGQGLLGGGQSLLGLGGASWQACNMLGSSPANECSNRLLCTGGTGLLNHQCSIGSLGLAHLPGQLGLTGQQGPQHQAQSQAQQVHQQHHQHQQQSQQQQQQQPYNAGPYANGGGGGPHAGAYAPSGVVPILPTSSWSAVDRLRGFREVPIHQMPLLRQHLGSLERLFGTNITRDAGGLRVQGPSEPMDRTVQALDVLLSPYPQRTPGVAVNTWGVDILDCDPLLQTDLLQHVNTIAALTHSSVSVNHSRVFFEGEEAQAGAALRLFQDLKSQGQHISRG